MLRKKSLIKLKQPEDFVENSEEEETEENSENKLVNDGDSITITQRHHEIVENSDGSTTLIDEEKYSVD